MNMKWGKSNAVPPSFKEPICVISDPFQRFLLVESADGLVLLIAAVAALVLANSPLSEAFLGFWQLSFGFKLDRVAMHMPLCALANAGVALDFTVLREPVSVAVMTGLFIGKPLGIFVFSWLAVKFKLARLPGGATWPVLAAGGILGGIGFTMALFIGGLALSGELLDAAKVGIMTGSALSAVVGMTLIIVLRRKAPAEAVCTLDDGGEEE